MQPHDHDETAPNGRQYAPWERTFTRILTPFEEFIHRQTTTGLVLMGTTVLALLLANSPLAQAYHHLVEAYASIGIGSWKLELSVHHWVNDGLMALFFFVVGLELKRELLVGELSQPRQAALPIAAAIGGMAVPALLYFLLNHGADTAAGWGIPMATDIAFAIGVMVLLAARVPLVLCTFNLSGVRKPLPYFLVSLLLWYALLQSGVHATLAGVIGAFTVPTRPKYDPAAFSSSMRALLNRFDASHRANPDMLRNSELVAVVQTMENGVNSVQPPLQQLEHQWHHAGQLARLETRHRPIAGRHAFQSDRWCLAVGRHRFHDGDLHRRTRFRRPAGSVADGEDGRTAGIAIRGNAGDAVVAMVWQDP